MMVLMMIPYDTIWCHTIPYDIILYHTIPYNTIRYHTIPYYTLRYHTISYDTKLYHTIQYYMTKHFFIVTTGTKSHTCLFSASIPYWTTLCSIDKTLFHRHQSSREQSRVLVCHQHNIMFTGCLDLQDRRLPSTKHFFIITKVHGNKVVHLSVFCQ